MMCYEPILIYRKRDVGTFKNDERIPFYVPCGRCLACRQQKSSELAMRAQHESMYYDYGRDAMFITLTYNKKNVPDNYSLDKAEFQKFMKRLRKRCDKEKIGKLKYIACGEYGTKRSRPHYHAIIYGLRHKNMHHHKLINESWNKGYTYIGSATADSIAYCTKYLVKDTNNHLTADYYKKLTGREKPFRLISKGLGKRYCLDFAESIKENQNIMYNGIETSIPRTYMRWLGIQKELQDKANKKKEDFILKISKKFNLNIKLHDDEYYRYELYNYDTVFDRFKQMCLDKKLKYEERFRCYLERLRLKKKLLPLEVA